MFWKYAANSQENTQRRSAIPIKLLYNFIEIALWHGCSAVSLLHIFRTPFLKNTSQGLLVMFLTRWSLTLFAVTPLKRFFSQPCFQHCNTLSCTRNLADDFLFTSFQQKMKLKKGNTRMKSEYLLFCESKWMICLTWSMYRFKKKFDRW